MKTITCFICNEAIEVRPARGRRSGKPFLMLICRQSGKHFRGFITDQEYVAKVVAATGTGSGTGRPA